ncbi:flagellar hook-associated protein FlgL [Litchfieldia salsa]|uniref:Flagellar hook-associated protein 3 FlgL n=1 Tax=Litchfieldia salsa TaxID=930152 RepID=A0A1H0WWS6_9BACI|nr:flagellar hook-associated protein FlgL [Litchfieldia salsa]SDP95049.1 flagellar hook-associated protein 3 FlgL [Litchfieldia salsa]
MRVTQTMLSNNMLKNLSQSYSNMGKLQDQLATGKKITKPSDDPVVAIKGMRYRTDLTEVEQYQRNLSEVYNWMESSDSALDDMTNALQRVRELTVQASNGTNSPDDLKSIAVEVKQIKEHIANISNTKVGNKYLFNGSNTTVAPIDLANGKIAPDNNNQVLITVSKGVNLNTNVDGTQLFTGSGSNLFEDLENLVNAMETGSGDIDNFLTTLDSHASNVTAVRADLGARYNRVELIDDRLSQQSVIATKIISDNEDAELEKVIIDLTTQESVHRAALGVGSRIIQPSLLDFLR